MVWAGDRLTGGRGRPVICRIICQRRGESARIREALLLLVLLLPPRQPAAPHLSLCPERRVQWAATRRGGSVICCELEGCRAQTADRQTRCANDADFTGSCQRASERAQPRQPPSAARAVAVHPPPPRDSGDRRPEARTNFCHCDNEQSARENCRLRLNRTTRPQSRSRPGSGRLHFGPMRREMPQRARAGEAGEQNAFLPSSVARGGDEKK